MLLFMLFSVIQTSLPEAIVKRYWVYSSIYFYTVISLPILLFIIIKQRIDSFPVKNATWILMEIPCHFTSSQFELRGQMHTKFHDASMSFIQILFVFRKQKHDMDFGQGQVMEFPWHLPRKWRDFHRIWAHFRTKLPSNNVRKSLSHFLQGNS